MRAWSLGWALFLLSALALIVVAGAALQGAVGRQGQPTPWSAPAVSTTTPARPTSTAGWWGDLPTAPAWPTDVPTITPGGQTPTAAVLLPSGWPTLPQPTWLFATSTPGPW